MPDVLIFVAGMLAPFVVYALFCLGVILFSRGHGRECVVGDFAVAIGERPWIATLILWRWHRLTAGRKAWHREAIEAWRAKWKR